MVTIEQFRGYLRNPPDDDQDLEMYLNAAKQSAKDAEIPEYENNAKYDLFICALAAYYYENRGLTFSGSYQATAEANARKLVNSFVLELRYGGGADG